MYALLLFLNFFFNIIYKYVEISNLPFILCMMNRKIYYLK